MFTCTRGGNSGTGKTHIPCAIGHALIEAGHRGFYARTSDLVQRLLAARRDLVIEAALARLDKFDLIILDDITYAQKDQAETGVLFELIARCYEYRSIAIAANQPFSGWDLIFPDKAMTVAAIDRLVHPRDHPRNERRKLPSACGCCQQKCSSRRIEQPEVWKFCREGGRHPGIPT